MNVAYWRPRVQAQESYQIAPRDHPQQDQLPHETFIHNGTCRAILPLAVAMRRTVTRPNSSTLTATSTQNVERTRGSFKICPVLRGLVKRSGDVTAVGGVNLEVCYGGFVVSVGPSGYREDHDLSQF